MAGNIENKYGTSNQTITCTFTSLTNGSQRQSTAIDNSSNVFQDILVFMKVKAGAASTATSGVVNLYALGSADGGTTYTENAGASDAAITLTVPPNTRPFGQVNVVANAVTYYGGPFSMAQAFGGSLPDHVVIVVENKTGGTLDGTIASMWYQGVLSQYT